VSDFYSGFQFVGNIDEYHYDSWKDIAEFMKHRKAKFRTLDERITEAAKNRRNALVSHRCYPAVSLTLQTPVLYGTLVLMCTTPKASWCT
jgi:hypothetical protein